MLHIIINIGIVENRKVNTLEVREKNHIYYLVIDKKRNDNNNE